MRELEKGKKKVEEKKYENLYSRAGFYKVRDSILPFGFKNGSYSFKMF